MEGTGDPSAEQDVARVVHERLCGSRVGRRWERIFRSHRPEVLALVAVHPALEERMRRALWLLEGCARRTSDQVGEETVAAVAAVLDDLDRLGTLELRREVQGLRDELAFVRGHSFAELLAG